MTSSPTPATRFVKEAWSFRRAIKSRIGRIVHNPADVEELTQEVMIRVWRRASTDGIESVRHYCLKAAYSVACDFLRHHKVIPLKFVASLGDIHDEQPWTEDAVNDEQERQLLYAAIAKLHPKQRTVIRMRKIHGMSQKEIAAQLKISENTVEDHLKRGVVALATAFECATESSGSIDPRRSRRTPDSA